jgi:uracil-DNA glycosylase
MSSLEFIIALEDIKLEKNGFIIDTSPIILPNNRIDDPLLTSHFTKEEVANLKETVCLERIENVDDDIPFVAAIEMLKSRMGTWIPTFERSKFEFSRISTALQNDVVAVGNPYPLKNNLFKAFEHTPLDKVKVVIFGQDPYPQAFNGEPRAQGLSFSVKHEDAIPSSLKNIFKEIQRSYPEWVPPLHGNLEGWAEQGVLLLNSCLTCRPGQPGYHSKYKVWMPFIVRVLKSLEIHRPNCIYVMWGAEAQKMSPQINEKSIQLTSSHPSGLSAYRGFVGCGHFKTINTLLVDQGEMPIKW